MGRLLSLSGGRRGIDIHKTVHIAAPRDAVQAASVTPLRPGSAEKPVDAAGWTVALRRGPVGDRNAVAVPLGQPALERPSQHCVGFAGMRSLQAVRTWARGRR